MLQKGEGGSSPRLRGTAHQLADRRQVGRFIPAPAGNSLSLASTPFTESVHPRACGEQCPSLLNDPVPLGSSPRLRGTGESTNDASSRIRFIPAPAGNSHRTQSSVRVDTVHPRACGEQPLDLRRLFHVCGSSPRLRGTVARACTMRGYRRFIPAPAGNRVSIHNFKYKDPVHPRACGEQASIAKMTATASGSSPRLRGTVYRRGAIRLLPRFIPAPAGNSWPPGPTVLG